MNKIEGPRPPELLPGQEHFLKPLQSSCLRMDPETVKRAVARLEHERERRRAKYERTKEAAKAYNAAYYKEHRDAILQRRRDARAVKAVEE